MTPRKKKYFSLKINITGMAAFFISVSAVFFGLLKHEVALELLGGIFFICLTYCFLVILITGFLYRKKAALLAARIVPDKVESGGEAFVLLNMSVHFFQMPFCVIRYKIDLYTKDKKRITHIFEKVFFKTGNSNFIALSRGAYYADFDYVIIEDIFGFFMFEISVPQSSAERLFVMPYTTEKMPDITTLAAGAEKRSEQRIVKNDDLTDQRMYVPGDDTRRINWKLYSHSGELFVRKEDTERPPHSRLVVLIDTEAASCKKQQGYDKDQSRAVLDAICSAALSFAADCSANGVEVVFGWNGSGVRGGAYANCGTDIPRILSLPACIPQDAGLPLPAMPEEKHILIFALPFINTAATSIEKYLAAKQQGQEIEILFCYNNEILEGAANARALKFFRTEGVRAKAVRVYDKD
ncbi:hypothetical protein FACS1894190_04990 [Spirochaetia bacterium]|nr:hypothetical protein FACS1894190_04990 [Spirochaetia bacterium]